MKKSIPERQSGKSRRQKPESDGVLNCMPFRFAGICTQTCICLNIEFAVFPYGTGLFQHCADCGKHDSVYLSCGPGTDGDTPHTRDAGAAVYISGIRSVNCLNRTFFGTQSALCTVFGRFRHHAASAALLIWAIARDFRL